MKALCNIDYNINQILQFKPDYSKISDGAGFIVSQPELIRAVIELASSQSLAYSCLFDNSKKRGSESPLMHDLRIARVESIRSICQSIQIKHLRDRGFRNAVTHFDERYLSKIMEFHGHPYNGLQDVGLTSKKMVIFPPNHKIYIIRVYYFDVDEFWLFDECLKLLPLRQEIDDVMLCFGNTLDKNSRFY